MHSPLEDLEPKHVVVLLLKVEHYHFLYPSRIFEFGFQLKRLLPQLLDEPITSRLWPQSSCSISFISSAFATVGSGIIETQSSTRPIITTAQEGPSGLIQAQGMPFS